jgi:uncharacterized LabA/DUF88 family protein
MASGPGYSGPSEVHYLFVDGGALLGRIQNVSEKWYGGAAFEIDFRNLARNYTKVFYYDALPVRENGESEGDYEARTVSKREFLNRVANTDGVHVYEGDARRRRRRGLEQKKVDVMLTVDMLTHSFRKNMHKATLFTGDNDFKPLIDALVQDGMFVTLWYPPEETSRELMQAADARMPLTLLRTYDLLSIESRGRFKLPSMQYPDPPIEFHTQPLLAWMHDDERQCGLFHENGQYTVVHYRDARNRLQVTHTDENFLRYFCGDSLDIIVPQG